MARFSKSTPLEPTLVNEYEPRMNRLLPHEERRTRHGFGMLGFPVDKEKSGRLGQMRKREVVQSLETNQLGKQPTGSLYTV